MSFEGYTAEQLREWADHECGPWCMKPYEAEAHEIRTNLARYTVRALEDLAKASAGVSDARASVVTGVRAIIARWKAQGDWDADTLDGIDAEIEELSENP